jgi:hypothetical protein
MTQIELITAEGQLIALPFGQINVAATQTDVQLIAADPSGNDGYAAAFRGEVVALAWNLSAAITAGVDTIGATVNGTELTATTITLPADSATVKGVTKFARGKTAFVAGDVLGVELTTSGAHLPITTDLTVTLYVIQYVEGI